jgi:hypothetical protein
MTYYPDPARYQQLDNGDPYGPFDCTAWSAAYAYDAHTAGTHRTTGTKVRAESNEPKPDPRSPGLNLPQVDQSIMRISGDKVDLDTHLPIGIGYAQTKITDGRYAILQVNRGILVANGYGGGSGFSGGHAIAVSFRVGRPVIFDPLVRNVQRASWNVLWHACGSLWIGQRTLGYGNAFASFTRDVTPDWVVHVPARDHLGVFEVGGAVPHVTGHDTKKTGGFSAACSAPKYFKWKGHPDVKLVEVLTDAHAGWWIRAKFAERVG